MAARAGVLTCLVATVMMWAASVEAADRDASALGRLPISALLRLNPCELAPPPTPYDGQYQHINSSGQLDVRMLHDAEVNSIRDLEQVADDLQARTEQVSCEMSNTKVLLDFRAGGGVDCPLEPPIPYNTDVPLRVGSGFPDITAVVSAAHLYKKVTLGALGDVQARVQRLRCDQLRMAPYGADILQRNATPLWVQRVSLQPCDRPAASPSYVKHYRRVNVSGIIDIRMAIQVIDINQEDMESWLDDIQSRVERVSCQQANMHAQLNAAINAKSAENRGPTEANIDHSQILPPADGMMNERLRSRRYPPRTDDKAARESADPDLRVARAPPSDRGRPVEADCGDVQPEPSHVINTRYWECLNDLCTIWDASVMNLIVQARLDTQVIGDDLQVRMSRLTCQQRNINSQLTFLRDMGVRRAGAVSPAVTTQADRPYRALGRVQPREGEPQTPQLSICETARNARARGSPAAPGLERQCRAQGGE